LKSTDAHNRRNQDEQKEFLEEETETPVVRTTAEAFEKV
jgi:hypothetical protein